MEMVSRQKVHNLMRSIDKLQKENKELRLGSQEHRRSATFKKVETELGKQDVIIHCLLNQIHPSLSNLEKKERIEKILAGGPARVKVATRQELMLENELWKSKIANLQSVKKKYQEEIHALKEELKKEKSHLERVLTQFPSLTLFHTSHHTFAVEWVQKG